MVDKVDKVDKVYRQKGECEEMTDEESHSEDEVDD